MRKNQIKSNPGLDKADKVIKVIYFLLYFAWNIFLIGTLVYTGMEEAAQPPPTEGIDTGNLGIALVFVLFGVAVGSIGNGVIALLALIGLICAICNKGNPNRGKTIASYVFLVLLPIITQALIIGVGTVLVNSMG